MVVAVVALWKAAVFASVASFAIRKVAEKTLAIAVAEMVKGVLTGMAVAISIAMTVAGIVPIGAIEAIGPVEAGITIETLSAAMAIATAGAPASISIRVPTMAIASGFVDGPSLRVPAIGGTDIAIALTGNVDW